MRPTAPTYPCACSTSMPLFATTRRPTTRPTTRPAASSRSPASGGRRRQTASIHLPDDPCNPPSSRCWTFNRMKSQYLQRGRRRIEQLSNPQAPRQRQGRFRSAVKNEPTPPMNHSDNKASPSQRQLLQPVYQSPLPHNHQSDAMNRALSLRQPEPLAFSRCS